MKKIQDALQSGVDFGKKHYLWIIGAYIIPLLCGYLYHLMAFIKPSYPFLYLLLALILVLLYFYGKIGIHYGLFNQIQDNPRWKKKYTSKTALKLPYLIFHYHLLLPTLLIKIYSFLGFLVWLIPCDLVIFAAITKEVVTWMLPIIVLLALPAVIKLEYSWHFSQLVYYFEILKKKDISSGMALSLSTQLMKGHKWQFFILQIVLIMPRILLTGLVILGALFFIKSLILISFIGFTSYIIISLVLLPLITMPKLLFFKKLCK